MNLLFRFLLTVNATSWMLVVYGIKELNWNPSFQFASLSSDLANRLHK